MTHEKSISRVRQALSLIADGVSRPVAARTVGMSLSALKGWIIRSRRGTAPDWIAEEWDKRNTRPTQECDMCGKSYRSGMGRGRQEVYNGANIDLSFCSEQCEQEWDRQEAEDE